ncbi:carboxypeptidase-like regulatory domain-containing protein, partial [Dyadobacter sp. CY347]|uniref:carboxypeptidase-like regulatory domain-containing protein n=1 Tax=Dyadobacter sp. CY347 TaxID=2909336 RepID=UPI001F353CF6
MTKIRLGFIYFMTLIFSVYQSGSLLAQSSGTSIKGKIVDENNSSLSGVSIVEQGTSNGTVTDINGEYFLNVKSKESVLVFSYVGYLAKQVTVGSQSVLNVQLENDSKVLDAVVVVGYGSQKARDVTGATAKVSSAQIKEMPVLSLDQALLGRAAGVQVTENSAEPGGEISIKIRGIASITGSSEPLIVVDGIPMS